MASSVSIGQSVGRIEGPGKVAGRAQYAADIVLPGMLWGKCLHSPFPHARIVAIDTTRARRLPAVHAVITAADLPPVTTGTFIRDMPVLARDKVRFVGEKVAAVAAESLDMAEEALSLIDVQYEELPAVADSMEAMREGAPRVHDDPYSYEIAGERNLGVYADFRPNPPIPNVASRVFLRHGDISAGFAEADHVFEQAFSTPSIHQGYLEPRACLVHIGADGKVDVWASHKMPFGLRSQLARVVGRPPERIRVHLLPVGGDFGPKGGLMDTAVCYYLAGRTERPVKMVMSYVEELTAGNPRHASAVSVRTGVTHDGRITARRITAVFNSGAYFAFKPMPALHGLWDSPGPYRVPNTEIESLLVYTHSVPCGYMRGPGATQMVFALESSMDVIAHELGLDPLEFRLRNIMEKGDESPMGKRWRSVPCREVLEAGAQEAGWGASKGVNVGRGIAIHCRSSLSWPSSASLRIDADAQITLFTGVSDTGTGSHTVLQQIVAEELQVPLSTISVVVQDTDTSPYDRGTGASRVTYTAGLATQAAARKLRGALIELAAQRLAHPSVQVDLKQGRLIAAAPESLSLPALMAWANEMKRAPITCDGNHAAYSEVWDAEHVALGVAVAEVEVDPETGQVKLRKLVTAHDVGAILNPLGHQGQVDGGVVMGMGQGLFEELQKENGAVITLNLGDYKLPCSADVPDVTTVLVEDQSGGELPYGGKEIAERVLIAIPAAIANAVFDAVGTRLTNLPITAEKVHAALGSKRGVA